MTIAILVDADACPKSIKSILYRVANKRKLTIYFFANQPLNLPPSTYLKFFLVAKGFDVADKVIEQKVRPGDLVITGDIPLAASVIEQGAFALNPRGTFYDEHNIKQVLSMRNFMQELRDTGSLQGGPSTLDAKNQQAFANALDVYLAKALK